MLFQEPLLWKFGSLKKGAETNRGFPGVKRRVAICTQDLLRRVLAMAVALVLLTGRAGP